MTIQVQHGNSSSTDLRPYIAEVLKDKAWRGFPEILLKVEDHIFPERAVRFYLATAPKGRCADRPLDEKIIRGRRRGVYLALGDMVKLGMLECKNLEGDVDHREYKILRPWDEKRPRKPPKRRKGKSSERRKGKSPKKEVGAWHEISPRKARASARKEVRKRPSSLAPLLERLWAEFVVAFPDPGDRMDIEQHCRALRNLAGLSELPPLPLSSKPEKSKPIRPLLDRTEPATSQTAR